LDLKRQMRQELCDFIWDEAGKKLDPEVLTVIWARRFTQYKRAGLIFYDPDRLEKLLNEKKIQMVFAGKFHPKDLEGRDTFNLILQYAKNFPNLVVMPNYELELSRKLKKGGDVWLNTPLRPLEASGTSGMSANMNGTVHLTTYDGWSVEGTFHELNGFIINVDGYANNLSLEDQNIQDYQSMMDLLENRIIPTFYNDPQNWAQLMMNAIHTSEAYFHSDRMAIEYFNRLYRPITL